MTSEELVSDEVWVAALLMPAAGLVGAISTKRGEEYVDDAGH